MLTKSDNVDHILDLDHNGHTVVAWSMNEPSVSRRFEIGAPPFERRLAAARKVQQAGYSVRVRLDPIVSFEGWQEAYGETIRRIFEVLDPQRITLGTLRFEEGFYRQRNTIFATGSDLRQYVNQMCPMLPRIEFTDEMRNRIQIGHRKSLKPATQSHGKRPPNRIQTGHFFTANAIGRPI